MENKTANHLEQLTDIKSMMERSSKFISLSGFSGIWVGSMALIGFFLAYYNFPDYFSLRFSGHNMTYSDYAMLESQIGEFFNFIFMDAILILLFSMLGALAFTFSKTKKQGLHLWDNTSRRFLISLGVPLFIGGMFILAAIYQQQTNFVVAMSLVFYGLALYNAGRYSLIEIRYLGVLEIGLGLLSAFFLTYAPIFWAFGFGVLHIVYGTVMYFKYDRK